MYQCTFYMNGPVYCILYVNIWNKLHGIFTLKIWNLSYYPHPLPLTPYTHSVLYFIWMDQYTIFLKIGLVYYVLYEWTSILYFMNGTVVYCVCVWMTYRTLALAQMLDQFCGLFIGMPDNTEAINVHVSQCIPVSYHWGDFAYKYQSFVLCPAVTWFPVLWLVHICVIINIHAVCTCVKFGVWSWFITKFISLAQVVPRPV